ncbi:hypothetical protein ACFLU6_04240 [Acidobacteriota bacterium]
MNIILVVSTGVIAIATVFIAYHAHSNSKLMRELEGSRNAHHEELSDIYQATLIATLRIAPGGIGNLPAAIEYFNERYKGKTAIFKDQ